MSAPKMLLLIDLANLNGQTKPFGRRPDLPALVRHVEQVTGAVAADIFVYAPLPLENSGPLERYHDWLRSRGFVVVTKRAKRLPDGKSKCNLDIELAVDALELARSARPDTIVIASGDGDMAPLVHVLRRQGVHVVVASAASSLGREVQLAAHSVIRLESWINECGDFMPQQKEEKWCA